MVAVSSFQMTAMEIIDEMLALPVMHRVVLHKLFRSIVAMDKSSMEQMFLV